VPDFTNDPFARNQLPAAATATTFTREDRVATFGRVMQALLDRRLPDAADAFFVGGAGMAYLEHGQRVGDLERIYLRVTPERGSHFTVAAVWARIKRRLHQQ